MIADQPRIAGRAALAGTAERAEIVVEPGPAGGLLIQIGMSPGIDRWCRAFQVWASPIIGIVRLGDERLQAILRAGIGPDIQLVEIEHAADPLERLFRYQILCVSELAQHRGGDQPDQQAEDDDDDQQLEQREAGLRFLALGNFRAKM